MQLLKGNNERRKKKYSGYGYHGGGRKATGIKRVSICISGQPEQIEKLKKMAAREKKTVSAFIFEKTGVNKMNENKQSKKIYFIEYYGASGNGYISYDNDICNSLDMAMTFNTEEEAKEECKKLQKELNSELKVTCYIAL